MVRISFSWDDGAIQDLKLMDLLLKLEVPSIFFIPGKNAERPVLEKEQIRLISANGLEIGAHTYSHQYLNLVSNNKAKEEIVSGKDFLEQILGQRIRHFCFPGGKYKSQHLGLAKTYFDSARTADTGAIMKQSSFLIKPAFQFFSRGKKSILYNSMRNFSPIFPFALKSLPDSDYFNFILSIINDLYLSERDYLINIWGHSWELEKNNLWMRLESFIKLIKESYEGSIISYSDSHTFDPSNN